MSLKKFDPLFREIVAVRKWHEKCYWEVMTRAQQLIAQGITWDPKKDPLSIGCSPESEEWKSGPKCPRRCTKDRLGGTWSEVWRYRVPLTHVWPGARPNLLSLQTVFFTGMPEQSQNSRPGPPVTHLRQRLARRLKILVSGASVLASITRNSIRTSAEWREQCLLWFFSLEASTYTLAAVCHRHYKSIRGCLIMHVEHYC